MATPTPDALGLGELGRQLAAMTDAELTAYLAAAGPEDLDLLEEAVALAEADAGADAVAAGRARERETLNARYARWWSDPAAFAADAIAWPEGRQLYGYQGDALTLLATRLRLAVAKLHGVGGTAVAALSVLWFVVTRDFYGVDWKVITTAGGARHLERYLWPEVHKWTGRLRWEQLGRRPWLEGRELLLYGIKLAHGEAMAVASSDPGLIEGAHASQLLYVFDEAKTIRPAVFDAAEGAFASAGPETGSTAYALALSTPGAPAGRLYDITRRAAGLEDWATLHVGLAEAIAAGAVSATWAEARRAQWGSASALYRNRVLGEFATEDSTNVIPLSWVEAANERWLALSAAERAVPATEVGVDVAREGADRSVLIALGEVAGGDGPGGIVAGRPVELARGDGPTVATGCLTHVGLGPVGPLVVVDADGVGASVYDSLRRRRDLGERVVAFHAGSGTDWRDVSGELHFANLRAAAWWHLRELLDPALGATLAIPDTDSLTGDLTAPTWRETTRGIVIESKDEIRKRLGRSTDDGDALVHATWGRIMRRGLALRPAVLPWSTEGRADDDALGHHDWMHEGL